MTYDIGDVARLFGAFTDINGAPADPTTVIVSVKDPNGTVTTPAVVRDSLGNYHADQDCSIAGTWKYQFDGTGAVKASGPGTFRVRPREV